MATRKASSAKLTVGEDTITRANPRLRDGVYWLDWSARIAEDRPVVHRRSKGRTQGEARARARATLAALKREDERHRWKPSASMSDYIDQVSRPAIENADLRPSSRSRYLGALQWLADAFKGHTIASATHFRALEDVLKTIATEHSPESAHQARSVLSKYVLSQLIRDEVITASPIRGQQLDLGKSDPVRGGRALSRDQWRAVVNHWLALDPAEGVAPPKRGMYTLADRIAVRRNALDISLLQATTGLRVSEAAGITWLDVSGRGEGRMAVTVTANLSKTHRARTVPVLDERVAERIRAREGDDPTVPVIGSPAKPEKIWEQRQRARAIAELYVQTAEALDIELLVTARSHVWRATLNTIAMNLGVPADVRSASFGHTQDENRQSYTDLTDLTPMTDAMSAALEGTHTGTDAN